MNNILEKIRDEALKHGTAFVEARACRRVNNAILLQDGNADKLFSSDTIGIGVRVIADGAWGFASAAGTRLEDALTILDSAIASAKASKSGKSEGAVVADIPGMVDDKSSPYVIDPKSVSIKEKMKALESLDKAGLAAGSGKIVNRVLSYTDGIQEDWTVNSLGANIHSRYVRTSVTSTFIASDGETKQRGYSRKAALSGYELLKELDPSELTSEAACKAVALLLARRAPSGKFPVIFHPSITGLLTHEALGHNAEADHVTSKTSILEGKLGEQVASPLVTIIDDATIPGSWGSYFYDSEGLPGQHRILIENGRLVGFLHNMETAAKLGAAPNGCGRAQDYAYQPIVRMSNTYIAPGISTLAEMIKDIDIGVYLTGGQWGYVFCERGQFTCHAGGGRMIRNGELAEPIRDVSIAGVTLDCLSSIDAVGNDLELSMPGMCGKCGQGMPINAGGPHVRVKELVVGGQEDVH